jgi:hypothetical protein
MSATPNFFSHCGCLITDSHHRPPSRPAVAPTRTTSSYHASLTRRPAVVTTRPIHRHWVPSAHMSVHMDRSLRPTSNTAATSTRSQLASGTSLTTRTPPLTSCLTSSPSFAHHSDPPSWTAHGEPLSTPLPPQTGPSPHPRAVADILYRLSPPTGQSRSGRRLGASTARAPLLLRFGLKGQVGWEPLAGPA